MNIKISAFKKLSDVNNPYNRDVFKCLERIRSGASKDKIEELRLLVKKKLKILCHVIPLAVHFQTVLR